MLKKPQSKIHCWLSDDDARIHLYWVQDYWHLMMVCGACGLPDKADICYPPPPSQNVTDDEKNLNVGRLMLQITCFLQSRPEPCGQPVRTRDLFTITQMRRLSDLLISHREDVTAWLAARLQGSF